MMDRLYVFLIRNDVWIYIVSALGLFWYITEFIRAQSHLRRAMFNLERETATHVRNNALSFILFLSAIVSIVYYVNSRIAPNLPEELLYPATPTPNIFATPLASPSPIGGIATPGNPLNPQLAPTVTLPGDSELVPEIVLTGEPATPEAIGTPFAECRPALTFTEPFNGAAVLPRITFRGTAQTGDGHQYVIELNGPQTAGEWAPITQALQPQPIVNGDLGSADLSQWQGGPYLVRIRAISAGGADIGLCVIQITLDN